MMMKCDNCIKFDGCNLDMRSRCTEMGFSGFLEKPQWWRFTFGTDTDLGSYYQPIYGTFSGAREKMFELYGDQWGFQYSEENWDDHPHCECELTPLHAKGWEIQ